MPQHRRPWLPLGSAFTGLSLTSLAPTGLGLHPAWPPVVHTLPFPLHFLGNLPFLPQMYRVDGLYSFPVAAITKCHKRGGLKQH